MRRKHCSLVLFLFAVLFSLISSPCFAVEPGFNWDIGTEIAYYKYNEEFMENAGFLYGLSGSLGYNFEKVMVKGEGRFNYGQVDYDGELQDGTPYQIDNIEDYIVEGRGLLGYMFDITQNTSLTPYFGIGYRYLNDDSSKDPAGYERESNYFYSPFGIESMTNLNNGWRLGANLEYDMFWFGVQKSQLSDAISALPDIENDQNRGYGIRASFKIVKETEAANFFAEPFIRYWSIEESDSETVVIFGSIIGTAVEPENDSVEYGIKLGIKY